MVPITSPQPAVSGAHRVRATLLGTAAVAGLLVGAAWAAVRTLAQQQALGRRATLETLDALPLVLWAALVLALLWAALLTVLATASVVGPAGRRGGGAEPSSAADSPRSGGPAVARIAGVLLALTAFGATGVSTAQAAPAPVTSGITATAGADPTAGTSASATPSSPSRSDATDDALPTPDWVPTAPRRTEQLARGSAPLVTGRGVPEATTEVVVHRGDTLWSIVARRLGPTADAEAIAQEWPRWYAANRAAIGDDPDLLLVGTRLHQPTPHLEGRVR